MSLEYDDRVAALRATAHPLRLQMLSLLTGAHLSAAEVARELDITQANASYHLRVLHNVGLLEITGEESVRGGRAKKYHHRWDQGTSKRSGNVDDATLQSYVDTMAQAMQARHSRRQRGVPGAFTDAELWVSPEIWQEALDLLTQASRLVHDRAQPPRTAGTVRTNITVAAFQMVPDPRGGDER